VVTGEVTGVLGAPPFCVLGVPPDCVLVDEPPVCVVVPELPVDPAVVDVDADPPSVVVDVDPVVDPDADVGAAAAEVSEPPQPFNKAVNATARAAARSLKVNMAEP
jgi:hypothetical protein